MSVRDITLEDTIDIKFTPRQFSDGAPTTAVGLAVAAYPGNSVTEITAGITTTFSGGFDARPGLVNVRIVATSANGYADNTDYALVVTAGTVGGTAITGEVVAEFTIGRSAAHQRIGAAGAALTALGGMSTGMKAEVETEVSDALVAQHLDHLFATDYDPALKPGVATALLNELVENDLGVSRFTANALEQAPGGGTDLNVLVDTTIATVTSQTVFTLTAGSDIDGAYTDQSIVLYDASNGNFPSVRKVTAYTGATKTVTIDSAANFTIIASDGVRTFVTAPGSTAPTAAQVADAVWDEDTASHVATGSFGEQCGTNIAAILTDTADMQPKLGVPAGASISADIAAIENQTDDIGIAGAGLTNMPWNPAWDVEVQSEVQDAIEANNLDHLAGTAVAIPAIPAGTYLDQMMDDGTAVFDRTTDSLQALRDHVGNGTNLTEAGGTGDHLTGIPSVASVPGAVGSVTGNVNGNIIGSVGSLGAQAKLDVNAEADTALIDYDAPTNAEMVARTLPAIPLAQLEQNLENCLRGTASGTPTITTMVSDITITADDQFKGRIVTFDDSTTTAALRRQSTDITGCTAATNTIIFTALGTAPAAGDTFTIT